jgi:hypothetical protein
VALLCWTLVHNWLAEAAAVPREEADHDCRTQQLPIREPQMDPLEYKSASIGSASPEGLGMMGPKSSMTSMPSKVTFDWLSSSCSMCRCLLAPLVDMQVDIPSSTSGVEATTIVPIKWSMPLLRLGHSTTSLCWRACSTITDQQWLWFVRCCSIRANHLSQLWHLSFSMMTTTVAWKQDSR